jgi:hypothetical protein
MMPYWHLQHKTLASKPARPNMNMNIETGETAAQKIIKMIQQRDTTLVFTDMKTGERIISPLALCPELFEEP